MCPFQAASKHPLIVGICAYFKARPSLGPKSTVIVSPLLKLFSAIFSPTSSPHVSLYTQKQV